MNGDSHKAASVTVTEGPDARLDEAALSAASRWGTVDEIIGEYGGPRLEDAYLKVMRGAVTEVAP